MDLNLYLGLPRSPRRPRSSALALALASPSPPPPSASDPPAAMPAAAPEPYSPSRASIAASAAPDPPLAPDYPPPPFVDADPVPGYSPRSPSYQPLAPPYVPYDPLSTAGLADDGPLLGGGGGIGSGGASAHVRYSPSYLPLSVIPEDQDELSFAPYRPNDVGPADVFEGDDGSSLHPDFFDPEFRLRRLIELQRRRREGRSSHPYGDEPPDYAVAGEMMSSDGYAGNSRKNNVDGGGVGDEGLGEEKEEKNASAVNFECNICLDLAQEPVVTSCGHLFCWPCLYQWLHLHCNHSECPVCKGEVIESAITPIYGRGNSETSLREGTDGDSGLKIPPRPRGRRIESWRQRIRRPISRRFSVGIANTWRRVLGEEVHHMGSRIDGDVEASLREMINSAHRRVAPRLRARRSARVEANLENASFGVDHTMPQINAPSNRQSEENTSSVLRDGPNHWPRFSFVGLDGSSGLASISANLSRIFGRSVDSSSHAGASASSGNPQIPDDLILRPPSGPSQSVDQASASSTAAVIQGDGGIMDVAAEPNRAGTSRPLRRRRGSGSSLDVDGCSLHARKRRRLD